MELVRAAVLYADKVNLYSPGAAMLASAASVAGGSGDALLDLLLGLDHATLAYLGASPEMKLMLPKARRAFASPALRRTPQAREFRQQMREGAEELSGVVEGMVETAGASDLAAGLDAGIVQIDTSFIERGTGSGSGFASSVRAASGAAPATDERDTDRFIEAYFDKLVSLLRDPRSHFMFDDFTATLVRHMIDEGIVEPARLALEHAGTTAVGTGLIARLPTFPGAPLDELLDLRADLDDPLTRYRAAAVTLAAKLHARAFDDDLAAEIDDLWQSHINPALLEIRELYGEHSLVKEVARSLGTDLKVLLASGAAIYAGVALGTTLEEWLTKLAAAAGPLVGAATKGAFASAKGRGSAEKHDLFYLYELTWRM